MAAYGDLLAQMQQAADRAQKEAEARQDTKVPLAVLRYEAGVNRAKEGLNQPDPNTDARNRVPRPWPDLH